MQKFKCLTAIFSLIFCVSSLASNPQTQRIQSGSFISAFGGYAAVDWGGFDDSPFVSYSANENGGFAYGFSVGYRFSNYFALEGGWMDLPTVKGVGHTNADLTQPPSDISISSWVGYFMPKFLLEIHQNIFMDVGLGVAYRKSEATPSELFTNASAYYYTPVFKLAIEWDFRQNWFTYLQYICVPGYDQDLSAQPTNERDVPAVNFVGIGIGYKFSL